MNTASYLNPNGRCYDGSLPFNDGEVVAERERLLEETRHLSWAELVEWTKERDRQREVAE